MKKTYWIFVEFDYINISIDSKDYEERLWLYEKKLKA